VPDYGGIIHHMRKFVIKNRQKRKYVKKVKQTQSFSLSKTVSGMMPILVMIIAFMATIVISTSFRNALTQIHFHLEFPTISFRNPVIAIQTITQDSIQIGIVIWTMVITTTLFIVRAIGNIGDSFISFSKLLDPRPLLSTGGHFFISLSSFIWNILILLEKGTALYNSTLTQTKITIESWLISELIAAVLGVMNIFSFAAQGILVAMTTLWQIIAAAFVFSIAFVINATVVVAHILVVTTEFIGNLVFTITLTMIHFLVVVLLTIWRGITFAMTTVIATLNNVFSAIVHLIEIPFKVLYAFWLQIKPYVMIFNRHIKMTGGDLSNGFMSLGKINSIVNAKN
jgi:hypothetical protein